jgi:phage terminase large subunit GpA-like protein
VDASYNPNKDPGASATMRQEMNAVYAFCKRYDNRFVPVRDTDNQKDAAKFVTQKKAARLGTYYYVVDVNHIKDEIFTNIDLKEGSHAIHFLREYPDEFFKQFVSEVLTEDDRGNVNYQKINERNETLDTYVYARAVMGIIGADRWDEGAWDAWRIEISE